jgi:hypothetical protein
MDTATTALPYLVTIARSDTRMVHRSTCRKALANPGAVPSDDFTAGKAATCCKPRFVLVQETPPEPKPKRQAVPVLVRFHRGRDVDHLRPMTDAQNKVASLAYYHTAGINGDDPRIPTEQLREFLAEWGVTDPESAPWPDPIMLPNGVILHATAL